MSRDDSNKPNLAYGKMRDKLEPDDVDGKVAILTIASADARNFASAGRSEEFKLVLTFDEFPEDGDTKEKEYIVNATSYKTLLGKLGEDYRTWIGEQIVMAPTTTIFGNQTFEKIHVASPERWDKAMAANKKAKASK